MVSTDTNANADIGSAAARLAILELVAGYGLLLDAGFGEYSDPRWDERFGALWASDASFATYPDLAVNSRMPIRGREAIVAAFADILRSFPHPHFVRHLATNTYVDVLDVTAGTARARSGLIATGVLSTSELRVHRSGVYFDWFCIEDGRWRFARRDLIYDDLAGPAAPPPDDWFATLP
ncbi:MAG: nuclear transport factor 2 family protein [Pseudomonadales bacterium]